jgi:acetyl-CoA carboxylase carboxyl transferase subunit alpha
VEAAEALKLTSSDMYKNKLIDGVIKEPVGGAHTDRETTFQNVKEAIQKNLEKLQKMTPEKLVETRIRKFSGMGVIS